MNIQKVKKCFLTAIFVFVRFHFSSKTLLESFSNTRSYTKLGVLANLWKLFRYLRKNIRKYLLFPIQLLVMTFDNQTKIMSLANCAVSFLRELKQHVRTRKLKHIFQLQNKTRKNSTKSSKTQANDVNLTYHSVHRFCMWKQLLTHRSISENRYFSMLFQLWKYNHRPL